MINRAVAVDSLSALPRDPDSIWVKRDNEDTSDIRWRREDVFGPIAPNTIDLVEIRLVCNQYCYF